MATNYSILADKILVDTPQTIVDPQDYSGQFRSYFTYDLLGTDDDSGDIKLMMPLPTNFVPRELIVWCDGAATTGAGDIGLYSLTRAGGSVVLTAVDIDLFCSALAFTSAISGVDELAEGGFVTIDERAKRLWQIAGASADPGGEYWVAITFTADVDASTKLSLEFRGVV